MDQTPAAVATAAANAASAADAADAHLGLDRDRFLRDLLRELSGTLEDVVGLDEASGFIAVVGQRIGESLDAEYRQALGCERLTRAQVAQVLVDLKRRIQGGFALVSQDDDKLVFTNSACPFGDRVLQRPSLCMMTSNVFGVIAAENLGRAKVVLGQTIARGDGCCHVTVYLRPGPQADAAVGRDYFGGT